LIELRYRIGLGARRQEFGVFLDGAEAEPFEAVFDGVGGAGVAAGGGAAAAGIELGLDGIAGFRVCSRRVNVMVEAADVVRELRRLTPRIWSVGFIGSPLWFPGGSAGRSVAIR
jgi:hypothetical protein